MKNEITAGVSVGSCNYSQTIGRVGCTYAMLSAASLVLTKSFAIGAYLEELDRKFLSLELIHLQLPPQEREPF